MCLNSRGDTAGGAKLPHFTSYGHISFENFGQTTIHKIAFHIA